MGLLRRIAAAFRKDGAPTQLEIARQERRRCAEAYANAVEREDSRDMHHTLRRYRRATNAVLRLEHEVRL